ILEIGAKKDFFSSPVATLRAFFGFSARRSSASFGLSGSFGGSGFATSTGFSAARGTAARPVIFGSSDFTGPGAALSEVLRVVFGLALPDAPAVFF
ncbi:MAG: hypothetical protein ABMA13_23850, partial [Chthoniobacteraceae bacterium]